MAQNLLTDIKCKRATRTLYDGGGLILFFDKRTGAQRWQLKYAHMGRERRAGGGAYPDVALSAARVWRDDFRKALQERRDPIAEKQAAIEADKAERAKADTDEKNTLEKFAVAQHARIKGQFRNAKHAAQWLASLRPVFDVAGTKPIPFFCSANGHAVLLDAVAPLVAATPETGRRVKQRLRAVFDAAKVRRLITYNPMREIADAAELKPRKPANKSHLPAMPYADVAAFLAELRTFERASASIKSCLEFLILTTTRSGEARGARWSEIDEAARTWTIPAQRTKRNREHVVPLSRAALAVLKQARELSGGELCFSSPVNPDAELSDMALSMTMRRMGREEVPHGFRSSFADWARACTAIRSEAVELALSHVEQDRVKAAYMRDPMMEERTKLMEQWARYVASPPAKQRGKVVPFARKRAS